MSSKLNVSEEEVMIIPGKELPPPVYNATMDPRYGRDSELYKILKESLEQGKQVEFEIVD